jgi:hypothetical protein
MVRACVRVCVCLLCGMFDVCFENIYFYLYVYIIKMVMVGLLLFLLRVGFVVRVKMYQILSRLINTGVANCLHLQKFSSVVS